MVERGSSTCSGTTEPNDCCDCVVDVVDGLRSSFEGGILWKQLADMSADDIDQPRVTSPYLYFFEKAIIIGSDWQGLLPLCLCLLTVMPPALEIRGQWEL